MLDVHRLRVFRSVVASGSIHAAAVNLGYTPSAVSQHVAALQRETGLALVTRIGRGIQPTGAGLALAAEIDGLLSRLGGMESFVTDLRAGRTGSISIGYFASVGSAWMPHVVRALLAELPGIRLKLSLRDDLATTGEPLDIQIIVEQERFEPPPGIRAHHLLDDPYVVVLPVGHPLCTRKAIELAELTAERWVDNDVTHGWCRRNLIEACQAAGFSPPFHVETHDYPTAIAFVEAGIGITVMPRLGAVNLPPRVATVPLSGPTPKRSIYALVNISIERTPAVRAALNAFAARAESPDSQRLADSRPCNETHPGSTSEPPDRT
jgi:DNA-binding transcriptional LysR family regulator